MRGCKRAFPQGLFKVPTSITLKGGKATQRKGGTTGPTLNPPSLSTTGWTALGPKPESMTGCSGCFNYTTTEGRVNAIAVDPTTTTNGSIVADPASGGGGNLEDNQLLQQRDQLDRNNRRPSARQLRHRHDAIDPNNHNTVYAGTGDLNYGSFAMGSTGIWKTTDAGNTSTVLVRASSASPIRTGRKLPARATRSAKSESTEQQQ